MGRWYVKKGEQPNPDRIQRMMKREAREAQIREKLFPERKGLKAVREDGRNGSGSLVYVPERVRGCPDGKKPVVVLAINEQKDILNPDYVPRWICICKHCLIRTDAYRTPEAAVNAWNKAILTPYSRFLHKRLTADTVNKDGITNLRNQIGKQAGNELSGYYRMKENLMEQGYNTQNELATVNGYIQDLEGFFEESFFFTGLDPKAVIEGLKKRESGEGEMNDRCGTDE